jgi:hypothetical protein
MELLEAKVGAGAYLEAITKVNQAMEGKKEKRKVIFDTITHTANMM